MAPVNHHDRHAAAADDDAAHALALIGRGPWISDVIPRHCTHQPPGSLDSVHGPIPVLFCHAPRTVRGSTGRSSLPGQPRKCPPSPLEAQGIDYILGVRERSTVEVRTTMIEDDWCGGAADHPAPEIRKIGLALLVCEVVAGNRAQVEIGRGFFQQCDRDALIVHYAGRCADRPEPLLVEPGLAGRRVQPTVGHAQPTADPGASILIDARTHPVRRRAPIKWGEPVPCDLPGVYASPSIPTRSRAVGLRDPSSSLRTTTPLALGPTDRLHRQSRRIRHQGVRRRGTSLAVR